MTTLKDMHDSVRYLQLQNEQDYIESWLKSYPVLKKYVRWDARLQKGLVLDWVVSSSLP
jgi:hypothetical protein